MPHGDEVAEISSLVAVGSEAGDSSVWSPFTLFTADWKAGIELSTQYRTAYEKSRSGLEQTYARLLRPSRQITFNIVSHGLDSFEALVFAGRAGKARHLVPLLCDASLVTETIGVQVFCDTTYRRFFVGARVIFIKPGNNGQAAEVLHDEIGGITDTAIETVSGLFVEAGWLACPAIEAEPIDEPDIDVKTNGTMTMRLAADETSYSAALPPTDTTEWEAALTTVNSLPLFWPEWEWRDGAGLSFASASGSFSSGNATTYFPQGENPRWKGSQKITAYQRSQFWSLLNFFDYSKGRAKKFLNAIPLKFLVHKTAVTTTVDFPSLPSLTDWDMLVPYLAFLKNDGTMHVSKVDSVARSAASGRDTVTLSTAPSSTINRTEIYEVRALIPCRLASDTFTEKWLNNQVCEIELAWEQANEIDWKNIGTFAPADTSPILNLADVLACPAPGYPPTGGGDCETCNDCDFDPEGVLNYSFNRTYSLGFSNCPNPYSVSGTALYVSCGLYEDDYYRFSWNDDGRTPGDYFWEITYIGTGTDPRSTPDIDTSLSDLCAQCSQNVGSDVISESYGCSGFLYTYESRCSNGSDYRRNQFMGDISPACP